MLKDKEFMGRVCRKIGSTPLDQLSVTEVIRVGNTITGFVANPKDSDIGSLGSKEQFEFLIDKHWIGGSDLIISLLEKKISSLRRELKIREGGKGKNAKAKNGKNPA